MPAAPPTRARLIAFEGIDGSGKGTQSRRFADSLRAEGRCVELLSFPRYSETRFGQLIGRFLNGDFGPLDAVAPELASLLFAGDRLESRSLILDAMASADVVVCDRYVGSNAAHQGGKREGQARSQLLSFIEWLEHDLHALPRPDATVWLDVPPEIARENIARKAARDYTDREADLQEEDANHLKATAAAYADLASAGRWVQVTCVDGNSMRSEDELAAEIRNAIPLH